MSEDTLNEKLRYAIDTKVDAPFSTMGVDGIYEASNECEKICIQSQIDLLKSIEVTIHEVGVSVYVNKIEFKEALQSLTNKLNSIK